MSVAPPQATAALVAAAASAAGMVDDPVVGDALQYLDGEGWTVGNGSVVIGARVPGDLITDLEAAGLVGDPLYEVNFLDPVWDTSAWTYTAAFDLSPSVDLAASAAVLLVLDGVKMAATVAVNGQTVGAVSDQFLRYQWDVRAVLKPTGNVLTVAFTTSQDPANDESRWSACTGGWDWA